MSTVNYFSKSILRYLRLFFKISSRSGLSLGAMYKFSFRLALLCLSAFSHLLALEYIDFLISAKYEYDFGVLIFLAVNFFVALE